MKTDYWDNINERPIWVAGTIHLPLTKDEIKVLENILESHEMTRTGEAAIGFPVTLRSVTGYKRRLINAFQLLKRKELAWVNVGVSITKQGYKELLMARALQKRTTPYTLTPLETQVLLNILDKLDKLDAGVYFLRCFVSYEDATEDNPALAGALGSLARKRFTRSGQYGHSKTLYITAAGFAALCVVCGKNPYPYDPALE